MRNLRQPCTAGFTLIELAIVVVVIGILAAISLPTYNKIKAKAREAEAKANLHNIQVSVEQFGVDHYGEYPKYLIGGDNAYLTIGDRQDLEIGHIVVETPQDLSCDPLIRNGYQEGYPRNPFVRHVLPVQQYQEQHGDPLRSSFKDSHTGGTRFGPYGNVVGQVLCDARWMTWTYLDPKKNELVEMDTWANIQYKVYDIWLGNHPRPFLSGSFMYKSMGDIYSSGSDAKPGDKVSVNEQDVLAMDNRGKAVLPASTTNYILGVWGDLRTKGKDVLGEEPMVIFKFKPKSRIRDPRMFIFDSDINQYTLPGPVSDQISLIGIPSWTRGVNRSHIGPLWGSPYGPAQGDYEQVSIGNPNGIKDAIILVLSSDSDFDRIEQ